MKFSTVSSLLAVAGSVAAAPAKRQETPNIDTTILQFALTLEHLENYFYSHALRRIPRSQFLALGFDKFYYDNLRTIASDEKSHVALLQGAITAAGEKPVLECTYNFSENMTAAEFLTLSSVLEGVGTSAYLGGAPLITSKDYLTVAGSILVTEALHTSLQRNANKLVPFPTPYGTPLDPKSIYTLAASFILGCPDRASSITRLGFTAYPGLTYVPTGTAPAAGSTVSFTTTSAPEGEVFVTFVSGLFVFSVPATVSEGTYSAAVPSNILYGSSQVAGQVYTFLTSVAAENNILANVTAGPAIVEILPKAPCFLGQPSCGVA